MRALAMSLYHLGVNASMVADMAALPMGSIYEGSMFVLIEMMILQLQSLMKVNTNDMRARHTNME